MPKHGKNYNAAAAKVEAGKVYSPKEAMTLAKELSSAKFDETVEVAVRLGVDTRKADQNIRGSISLPNGTGKTVRVAVFAEGAKAAEAEAAGADIVGSDDLIEEVQKGNINFDAVIATPNLMGKVGRLGRILGPRGLMPNPKLGTVTMDVEKAVKAAVMVEDVARTITYAKIVGRIEDLPPEAIAANHDRYMNRYGTAAASTGVR